MRDYAVLVALGAGGSIVAAVIGALVLRRFRRRTLRTQAVLIAVGALLSTIAGVALAAFKMFISSHDLTALSIVIVVSSAVGIGAAFELGSGLELGTRSVRDLARQLGTNTTTAAPGVARAPEFDELAVEVADLPRRLEELRERADTLERSRRELVAWVSHDLRSPLAAIRAMAEALDDGVVTDEPTQTRYHHRIRQDSERLSALVDDLFELSRISSGKLVVQRDRVSLDDVLCEVVSSQERRAEVAGVRLVSHVDHAPVIDVAVVELSRVLHNVIDNAIRHTPRGGEVVVRLEAVGNTALVSVEDQCGGIPEPDLDRVFDVAFRGDAARSPSDSGGGLGLAIAKGLVEACEGAIAVDNVSAGCRFTVTLPLPA